MSFALSRKGANFEGLVRIAAALGLDSRPLTLAVHNLPELPLPDWAAGIRIGGAVTSSGLLFALYEGLRLATLLACFGAANSLANPSRLLPWPPPAWTARTPSSA